AQTGDGPTRATGDLRSGVQIHVGRAEVADREAVTAEVDGPKAVVHAQLRAVRVVDAGPEHERLRVDEPAQPRRGVLPPRRGLLESFREEGCLDELHDRCAS